MNLKQVWVEAVFRLMHNEVDIIISCLFLIFLPMIGCVLTHSFWFAIIPAIYIVWYIRTWRAYQRELAVRQKEFENKK